MICRTCGTEIADKALICYRCGTPTSSPAPAVRGRRRGSPLRQVLAALGLLVLVLAALFLGLAGEPVVPPAVSYGVAGVAAVLLVWRLWRRRG